MHLPPTGYSMVMQFTDVLQQWCLQTTAQGKWAVNCIISVAESVQIGVLALAALSMGEKR